MAFVDDLSIYAVCDILENSGVDHLLTVDSEIYVTGLGFNFWIKLVADAHDLLFSTYWVFAPGTDEHTALHFVNKCNLERDLVQFAYLSSTNRLSGYHVLSCRHGLTASLIARTAHRFSQNFQQAVEEAIASGLMPPGEGDATLLVN